METLNINLVRDTRPELRTGWASTIWVGLMLGVFVFHPGQVRFRFEFTHMELSYSLAWANTCPDLELLPLYSIGKGATPFGERTIVTITRAVNGRVVVLYGSDTGPHKDPGAQIPV